MEREIRIEILDGKGRRTLTKKGTPNGITGSVFLSLEHAEVAHAVKPGGPLTPALKASFAADGIIVHDEECNWW